MTTYSLGNPSEKKVLGDRFDHFLLHHIVAEESILGMLVGHPKYERDKSRF